MATLQVNMPIKAEQNEDRRDPRTGLIPCLACTQCCHYVAIEIDEPESREEFDNIRWYLYHPGIEIFVDHEDTWNVLIHTTCENLLPDGKCNVYDTRPVICRNFPNETCEPNTGEPAEKVLLRTAEDLDTWMRLTRTDALLEAQEAKRHKKRRGKHHKHNGGR
jgi:Fe-S-cluster containining protein